MLVAALALQWSVETYEADRSNSACDHSFVLPTILRGESHPLEATWLSASALSLESTTLHDLSAAPAAARAEWIAARRQNRALTAATITDDECSEFLASVTHWIDSQPIELGAEGQQALKGIVVEVKQGFFKGIPGSLLLVEVDDALPTPESFYHHARIFVLASRLRIGDQTYCAGYAPPSLGDRILLVTGGDTLVPLIPADPMYTLHQSRTRGIYGSSLLRELTPDAKYLDDVWEALSASRSAQP
jgi:hypothetical protein